MKLLVKTSKKEICSQLKVAKSFTSRLVGLIGTKKLVDEGLMIPNGNWIHTLFMSIPIDVLYVDKNLCIRKIDHNLKPWTVGAPVFSARSVIELPAGLAKEKQLNVGDELYVGH